jgi:hypothetical protein
LSWLNKTTLDIIGLAGFSYRFDALSSNPDSPNELYAAFDLIFRPPVKIDAWLILVNIMPFLRFIVSSCLFYTTNTTVLTMTWSSQRAGSVNLTALGASWIGFRAV